MDAETKRKALEPLLGALTLADRSKNRTAYEKSLTALDKENRRLRAIAREAGKTAEERLFISEKIGAAQRCYSKTVRSARAKHASLSRSREKRCADAKKAAITLWKSLTPEEKSEFYRKRSLKQKNKGAGKDTEQCQ